MNQGTLNELRADNERTHLLLAELIRHHKRTNELLVMQVEKFVRDTDDIKTVEIKPAPYVGTLETEPPPAPKTAKMEYDMGNIGPISLDTGLPVKPKPAAKKGK